MKRSPLVRKPKSNGLCQCGCGRTTRLAPRNDRSKGWIAGEPIPYVNAHNSRGRGLYAYEITPGPLATHCFVHLKQPNSKGYVQVSVGGRLVSAHRTLYERVVGPIPEGLQLDHLCRNRRCVNPGHLEPVTGSENIKRGHRARAA